MKIKLTKSEWQVVLAALYNRQLALITSNAGDPKERMRRLEATNKLIAKLDKKLR